MMKGSLVKGLMAITFLLMLPLSAKATAQEGDIIYINGEKWFLLGKPLNYDDELYTKLNEFLPKNRSWSTANWSGYTGYWEIVYGRLYLKKVVVYAYDKLMDTYLDITYDAYDLKELFTPYYTAHGINAEWYSNKAVTVGRGECIRVNNDAYDRNYAEELVMTFEKGEVMKEEYWRNKKVTDGCSLRDGAGMEVIKLFPYEQFPELETQRVIVHFRNVAVSADGRFKDCDADLFWSKDKSMEENPNPPIIIAFKETMRKVYPWETFYIHGKNTINYGDRRFSLPLGKRRVKN